MEGEDVLPASQFLSNFFILQKFTSQFFREFGPSWTAVANSWNRVSPEQRNQHFFATLDFEDGAATFQRVRSFSHPVLLPFYNARL
jgi:OST3 / OST6 family, transporter family